MIRKRWIRPATHQTGIAHSRLRMREQRLEAARGRPPRHGLQNMTFEQLVARLAGGLVRPVDDESLREAITAVLPETALDELDGIKMAAPGVVNAAAETLRKAWRAGVDLQARGWMVADRENPALAGRLIEETCHKQGVQPQVLTLHSDRGAPMTSKCTAQLVADLGVTRSLSRPQVSDDNPFSEAQFKTLKYHPGFPGRFHDFTAAIAFCRTFFPWYNTEHRHGGIAMLTRTTCITIEPGACWSSAGGPFKPPGPVIPNASFEESHLRSNRTVVEHLLGYFRRIRSMGYASGIPDERSTDIFLTVMAQLIEPEEVANSPGNLGLPEDASSLLRSLHQANVSAVLEEMSRASSLISSFKLFPALAIRHASSQLFQEAHSELLRASTSSD